MTTPQRALELADKLKIRLISPFGFKDQEDAEAILRHYAEIMQAEAVGYRVELGADSYLSWHGPIADGNPRTPLIIKPKPLP